jgi:GTP-binding protein
LKVHDAVFVTSAASARELPREARPQVAFVGRSNVGKSRLINALTRRQVARTSAAAGKTRLANVYRVTVTGGRDPGRVDAGVPPRATSAWGVYLVDLPGYGYARGGAASAAEFAKLTAGYFGEAPAAGPQGAVLLVDSRHPGLATDLDAWRWLASLGLPVALVATKVDKLGRAERARALEEMERSFNSPALPVSAVTGEGMDTLWKVIARLVS